MLWLLAAVGGVRFLEGLRSNIVTAVLPSGADFRRQLDQTVTIGRSSGPWLTTALSTVRFLASRG